MKRFGPIAAVLALVAAAIACAPVAARASPGWNAPTHAAPALAHAPVAAQPAPRHDLAGAYAHAGNPVVPPRAFVSAADVAPAPSRSEAAGAKTMNRYSQQPATHSAALLGRWRSG